MSYSDPDFAAIWERVYYDRLACGCSDFVATKAADAAVAIAESRAPIAKKTGR